MTTQTIKCFKYWLMQMKAKCSIINLRTLYITNLKVGIEPPLLC